MVVVAKVRSWANVTCVCIPFQRRTSNDIHSRSGVPVAIFFSLLAVGFGLHGVPLSVTSLFYWSFFSGLRALVLLKWELLSFFFLLAASIAVSLGLLSCHLSSILMWKRKKEESIGLLLLLWLSQRKEEEEQKTAPRTTTKKGDNIFSCKFGREWNVFFLLLLLFSSSPRVLDFLFAIKRIFFVFSLHSPIHRY